ncbi:hypothetical protein ACEQ8H_001549 [Pleosporales sp. CAS-2024a]
MAPKGYHEDVDSHPPPIPRRNPLRDDSRYMTQEWFSKTRNENNATVSSTPQAPNASTSTSLVPGNTRDQSAGVSTHADLRPSQENSIATTCNRMDLRSQKSSDRATESAFTSHTESRTSLASTKSSLSDSVKRYSALLYYSDTTTSHNESKKLARQREIEEAMARIRRSLGISDTLSTISTTEDEEEDARVETWLQLGAYRTQSSETECATTVYRPSTVSVPSSHPPKTLPSISTLTEQRGYASPISPMNNGRDAYGNYIPTNTQDYFATLSSPTSIKVLSTASSTTGVMKEPAPNLRGGDGWWNSLGVYQAEKQPSLTGEKSTSNLRGDYNQIIAGSSKNESSVDLSHPRIGKRWHPEPTTRSPPQSPLPPSPPPRYAVPVSNLASSIGAMTARKCWQESLPSKAESYDDVTHEVQSIELRESVSVSQWRPQHSPLVSPMQSVDGTRSEDFKVQQMQALMLFRPQCQDIMMRYNTHMSKDRMALESGQMSLDTYNKQTEYLVRNMENSLKHSAEESGYTMISDERCILQAMSTSGGYAMYHDMLHTTQPILWQRLQDQHRLAQTMQQKPACTRPCRSSSRKSAARKAGGKIARFFLAHAPSDDHPDSCSTAILATDSNNTTTTTSKSRSLPSFNPLFNAYYHHSPRTHSGINPN